MLEIERHLVWIAVGEDQVVRPVELGQNISGLTADDADTVAVPVPCDLELGEAHVLGVAFDLLDEPARTVGEVERHERNGFSRSGVASAIRNGGCQNSEKRTAGGRIHAASPRPCVSRCS